MCKECKRKFRLTNYKHIHEVLELWNEYVFGKQTLRELSEQFKYSKKQLKRWFESFVVGEKQHIPKAINLVVDATFFGTKDTRLWGVVVFRDFNSKENLWWKFVWDEHTATYMEGRNFLEQKRYKILSVTCDGLPGLLNVFKGIPVQFCHFHQTQIVRRYVTENPKLVAGHELLELMQVLTLTNQGIFTQRLSVYVDRHREFLNEKTLDSKTGHSFFTHRRLRSAIRSIEHNLSHLFTYQIFPELKIPNTTNALESHFSHIKDVVRIHRGLSIKMKQKVIHAILLNSSIVLKPKRKE